ncbi:amino acid ABC transporter substrate-binding protein [Pseudomonas sp. Choline-3u-10]|jgi:polar amino acid transport system substrate-binding protein|uniref:substrate-binding periplasmic protein n=1 Tax=Pseudomonadaceae TaxID=135621 RepID=UPI00061822EA|nr:MULTISPECIES: ABC transporter substrate-binding protein [Pseudomonadaceae]MBU0949880.1 ABC transporter substrate-binding protein [Gammaproteobacteria bacterium]HBM10893.1 amino acid ABC transporter substrate-binding protein [Pseudomonas sp.]KJJ64496.1 amino acid ABC transporter substrate-binding protein [Pseudomonas sp. 10B238]MBK3793996.1 transporter substrate-binding domain-containing protein [Stutzerimonas stutzeri]MBK3875486.1 transporter substrate-binding domain-containing protein [Stu|tara:strand:- start:2011 stop:2757 length:747 start_codon:yes stop_codon:yes gene_type:complete
MRRILVAGLLLLMAASARAELPDDYKMVLLTENFPPFNMAADGKNYAADRNISGINAEIVREMFKRAGIAYSLTLRFPWERIYNQALEHPDQGLFSTTYTPEREPLFKWVGPLASTGWVLLAPAGSPMRLSSLDQAQQYRIGAYKNDAVSQHLESKGFEPINSLRDQENISKLLKGQIDLWATTDPVGPYLAKQEGVSGLTTVLRFNDAQLFLALNKQTPDEVVTRLQKALNEMKSDGAIDAIMRRYL